MASNIDGFGSISRRRTSCKPLIAAVNGNAYGGGASISGNSAPAQSVLRRKSLIGVEMILNCDLVVASQQARFALPEVKRGVIAIQGGLSAQRAHDRKHIVDIGLKQYRDLQK